MQPRVPAPGKKASKPLAIKTCGGCGGGRNFQSHRESVGGPRTYLSPPTHLGLNTFKHLKGCNSLVASRGSNWKWAECGASGIVPTLTLPPPYSTTMQQNGLPHPSEYLRLWSLNITGALRQGNVAQMKEHIKTPDKELSDEKIANLSDAEFKTLVIRMLKEAIEYGCKIKRES